MKHPAAQRNLHRISTPKGLLALVILPLLLVALGGAFVYFNLKAQSEREAYAHSQNVTKLLAGQTDAFIANRNHAVALLATETEVRYFAAKPDNALYPAVNQLLKSYCHTLHASICYLMDSQGTTIADSRNRDNSIVGNSYAFRPYFQEAAQGKSSVHLALGVTTKKRGIYFSNPIYSGNRILGVAVIKYLPDRIEENFQGLSGHAMLTDQNGIIFASSNPDWLYKSLSPLSLLQQSRIEASRQFGDQLPQSLHLSYEAHNRVSDLYGSSYLIESQPVTGLPGWQITYLLSPEQLADSSQQFQRYGILSVILFLFLLTLIAVRKLYLRLLSSIRMNAKFRYELEDSQARLQRFEEVTSEAIFIHNKNGIVDVNRRAEELFCYQHDQLMQLTPQDFFTPETLELALTHAREGIETPYQAAIITGEQEQVPMVVTGRSVMWNGTEARATSFRDIRLRVEVQRKLLASEDRFRQLTELVAEGLLIYTNHRIIDANLALCEILGIERAKLLARPLPELLNTDSLQRLEQLKISKDSHREITLTRDNGSRFPAEVTIASMQFDDGLYTVLAVRDISRQKSQEEHIRYQAQYDLLTNIPNRFLARDRAEQAMRNADKHQHKMALMFIDLDGFKKVNDSLGHDMGDQLLQQATERFQRCISRTDTLARHGGDEFILLLENIARPEDAEITLERILEQFSTPFHIDNNELIITASMGVAIYPDDASSYQALLRAADIGMYKAKKDGRNTFHYYTQEMNDIATRQLALDNNLRNALDNQELSLVYQPLYCGAHPTKRIIGAEALLRWHSDTLGFVSPVEFVPLSEQTGLIIPIGRWVLSQACLQAKQWLDQGHTDFRVSVNVSPRQFEGNDFIQDLSNALNESQLPAENLTLEVTEGLLIQASPELEKTLNHISDMGIKISMDDFGTGYSSLNYLKAFPFDNLKIDRSFTQELPDNKDAQILVSATIAMAHQLGLSVTAEGIETEAQRTYLTQQRCDILQGFLLGKPVTATELQQALNLP